MQIKQWIDSAWESLGVEIEEARYMMWKEASTITFPFYHLLEKTRGRYDIDSSIKIVPEHTIFVPKSKNAKCPAEEPHDRAYRRDKRRNLYSYDLAIIRVSEPKRWNKKAKKEYHECSIWCYSPEPIALFQAKYLGKLTKPRSVELINKDLKTLDSFPRDQSPRWAYLLLVGTGNGKELRQLYKQTKHRPKNLNIAYYLWDEKPQVWSP